MKVKLVFPPQTDNKELDIFLRDVIETLEEQNKLIQELLKDKKIKDNKIAILERKARIP